MKRLLIWAIAIATLAAGQAAAAPVLASLFVDHAVLQRDMPIAIFGTAVPNERLTIVFDHERLTTTADAKGAWHVKLRARPASERPVDLIVIGKDGARMEARNLLVGDVWLCSGQSNMEMQVVRALNSYNEIAAADDVMLRLVLIPRADPKFPAGRTAGPLNWKMAKGEAISEFSAACYYMARALRADRKVPVGAIAASWGSTKIALWQHDAPIYNGMVAPLGPYTLKGVAWYQGESDVGSDGYQTRLASLMKAWRTQFRNPDLPFLIAGLANFNDYATRPVKSSWAELREEQRQSVLSDAKAAMVPLFDVGDRTDVHPANKQAVGMRLAIAASELAYGETANALPMVRNARRFPPHHAILVTFVGVRGALRSWSGDRVLGFELCGAGASGCRFADARADGNTVVLLDDGKPAALVRYGWADSPVVNLYDDRALPPGPFQVSIDPQP